MTIDLKPFCHGDARRYMSAPFSQGSWTYATNGHIAIRVPRREDVPEVEEATPAIKVLSSVYESGWGLPVRPMPLVIFNAKELQQCRLCEGVGQVVNCADCDGKGVHGCDRCEEEHPCPTCRGLGKRALKALVGVDASERTICEDCWGEGRLQDHRAVWFGDQLALSVHYIKLVLSLPGEIGMVVREPVRPEVRDPARSIYAAVEHPAQIFLGTGWSAIVMPMRCPLEEQATGGRVDWLESLATASQP